MDIVVLLQTDTALVALCHFLHVVLETLQRGDLVFEDHHAVADDADLGLTGYLTVGDIGAGDHAHIGNADRLTHLGAAENDFLILGSQHTLHSRFNFVYAIVNDAVGAHVYPVTLCHIGGVLIGTDVEAHDDGVGGGGQHNIALRDTANGAVDNLHLNFLVGKLHKGRADCLGRSAHVGLNDDVEFLNAFLDLAEQILQIYLGGGVERIVLRLLTALIRQGSCHSLVLNGVELVTGLRNLGQTDDLNGNGRTCLRDGLTAVVQHSAYTANGGTGDHDIACVQCTVLHDDGGNGAAALIQFRLDHDTLGTAGGIGFQFLHFCHEKHVLKQIVNTHLRQSGNGHADRIAAPFLGNQTVHGQLILNGVGVGGGFIHLIDSNDHVNAGGLGVVDGFNGLGHDTVIGSNHQDSDIGGLGTAGTHGGERLMSGGIQEGNVTAVQVHTVRTDVLGNTAGLAGGYAGVTDGIQKRGLTVVNVAHYAHNGCAGFQILRVLLGFAEQLFFDGNNDFLRYLGTELVGNQVSGIVIDDLIDGGHHAVHHHLLDHLGGGLFQTGCQLAYSDLVGQSDLERHLLQLLQILLTELLHSQTFLIPVLGGTHIPGVLLLQLLLVGRGIGESIGCELIQTLIVLGQIHIGGAGIDDAGVTGSLLFHHRLLGLLRLGRTNRLEGSIVRRCAGIRTLSLGLRVRAGAESALLSLLEAIVRAIVGAAILLEAVVGATVLLEAIARAAVLLEAVISAVCALRILCRASRLCRCRTGSLSRCGRLCFCLGRFLYRSLGLLFFSLGSFLHGSLGLLFFSLRRFLHGNLRLLFFFYFGLRSGLRLLLLHLLAADRSLAAQIAVQILDLILPGQLVKEYIEFIRLKSSHIRLDIDAGILNLRKNLLIFHSQVLRQLIDLEHRCLCHLFFVPCPRWRALS